MAVPDDIENFLSKNQTLYAAFYALPPSHQKEYISWIVSAKKEETKTKRMEKMEKMILEKHRGQEGHRHLRQQ